MKKNVIASLSLLITCLAFSGQSFSQWNPWGLFNKTDVWCQHQGEVYSLANISIRLENGTTNRYMQLVKDSAFKLKLQLYYSNDRLRKDKPHFPFEAASIGRSHIYQQKHWMSAKNWESGESYVCRLRE